MSSHRQVAPQPVIGVLIFAAFSVLTLNTSVSYRELIPIWLITLLALVLTRSLGWWSQAFHEVRRTPPWTLAIPVFLAAGTFVGMLEVAWSAVPARTALVTLIATAGIAATEEIVTRGMLLVALRARYREMAVWFWTSALSALLHAAVVPHALAGTLQQLGLAFVLGSLLYGARRATGTLLVPILLHALWDFSSALGAHPGMAIAYLGAVVFAIAAAKRVLFRIGFHGPHHPAHA
ncbi:MAG: CPBP family intramembrane glutamic endopeptidase [Kofleriaceae bacterium]|nr:CPBP family intramembrane glutamic endopeptidase [Kofleriaceae bacterium]